MDILVIALTGICAYLAGVITTAAAIALLAWRSSRPRPPASGPVRSPHPTRN